MAAKELCDYHQELLDLDGIVGVIGKESWQIEVLGCTFLDLKFKQGGVEVGYAKELNLPVVKTECDACIWWTDPIALFLLTRLVVKAHPSVLNLTLEDSIDYLSEANFYAFLCLLLVLVLVCCEDAS